MQIVNQAGVILSMIIYIYALKDPETKQIRYIGRTKYPKQRLSEHHQIKRLKTKTHHNCWILSLLSRGVKAEIEILETCDENNWSEREKYWIANTSNLTNTTAGGEGEFCCKRPPSSEETKAKISKSVIALHSEGIYKETHKKISKSLQGFRRTDSPYSGVFRMKSGRYTSYIKIDRKRKHLGVFSSADEAAIAYDIKALELYGPSARLNLPERIEKYPTIL